MVAAADVRPERAELAKQDGIPNVCTDYRKLLERDDVDIIDCAVDHQRPEDMAARVQILKDAAKAGKAVLIQKPMATCIETAEEMVRIAEDAGIPFAVNQNLRFDPAIYLSKQFLAPERFGKPAFIQFSNLSIEGPKFGFGDDGVVFAWQIHGLDSVRWLSGGDPVSVYCTNRNNAAMYHIEYSNGAVCNYCEYHNEDNFRNETPLRIWAEKGAINGNHRWNPGSRWERDLIEVRGYDWPREIGWITYNLPDELTNRNIYIQPSYDMCGSIAGFIGSMGEFMQSLNEKRPALTNAKDNLLSIRTYFAGQLSAGLKRPVDPRTMTAV